MVKPSATRTCSQRSIATLKQDLVRFEEAGKAPGKAKECNNVIDSVFFEIPLERVRTISAIRKIFLQISNDCYWDILKYMFFLNILRCVFLDCTLPLESISNCTTYLRFSAEG